MASRDPGQPPQKPVKHKPKDSMTQEELGRRQNVRRRLFSGEDDAMIVDSPETSPIDEALDEAYRRYDFNFRTENPIAGGSWQWESFSEALFRAEASPTTSADSPVMMPPPREQHPRTSESLNSARPARVRSANRPRLAIYPQRRSRGRLLVRPSTARLDAAAALPFPELQGPSPPPRRMWAFSRDVPPPAPWVAPQRLEDHDPQDYDYGSKQ